MGAPNLGEAGTYYVYSFTPHIGLVLCFINNNILEIL